MNKKWFTLVELVVTMSIVVILSTISFISYSNYVITANNTQRKTDLVQISSAIKLFEKENGRLPNPSSKFSINNIFEQWEMDWSELNTITKVPTDPKIKNKKYTYSKIIFNWAKEEFQLAATLEWENPTALVEWNYYPVRYDYPSIIIVWESHDKNKFVLNWSINNLPYKVKSPYDAYHKEWTNIDDGTINKFIKHPYKNCDQIKKAWKFIWNWEYKTNNWESSFTCNN